MKFPLLITIPVPWHAQPVRIHMSLALAVIVIATIVMVGVIYFG